VGRGNSPPNDVYLVGNFPSRACRVSKRWRGDFHCRRRLQFSISVLSPFRPNLALRHFSPSVTRALIEFRSPNLRTVFYRGNRTPQLYQGRRARYVRSNYRRSLPPQPEISSFAAVFVFSFDNTGRVMGQAERKRERVGARVTLHRTVPLTRKRAY